MKRLFGLLFCLVYFSTAFSSEEAAVSINLGLLPGGNPEATQKQSYALAEKLQAQLGKPVKIFISKNYSGLIEALKNKKVDFAVFSSLTYVIAEKETPVKVLLKKTWEGPFYFSALVVQKKSKIKSIRDLKNKKIVFVDQNSTSGYLYPQVYLKKNKVMDSDFKSITFSGNHAASISSLESGQADVVAVFADDEKAQVGAWTRFSKKPELFRTIWTSEPIPNDPFVVRQQFYDENPKLTLEVMYDLIELNNDFNSSLFEILGQGSLMPATAKQYDPVREMYKVFKAELKL
jgi:phosphonate transport system substrate-binding protein